MTVIEKLKQEPPKEQALIIGHLFRRQYKRLLDQGLDPDVVLNAMLGMAVELTRAKEGDEATTAVLYGVIERIEREALPLPPSLQ